MNYRHSFHAGNFADLVKHALVLWLLKARQAQRDTVTVLDTHAGAGLYDLSGDAVRSREAEAGVARLMQAEGLPPLIEALATEVRAVNPNGGVRFYPGSPLLIAHHLRPDDRYGGFDISGDVASLLVEALRRHPNASGRPGDGFKAVLAETTAGPADLVLIDPPFEQPDDYWRTADTTLAILKVRRDATIAIWTPLKDLETFDGFLRRLGTAHPAVVAEVRLRPLINPMKMNGCAMVVVNPPAGTDEAAAEICGWVAGTLGEEGQKSEVWRL
ncbi:23S rRNA (adenine(2030)-N(6))-methyltransferase RlmJ [Brevundimonas goettingensis]|uniref:Ribosomal RNA large subunit methyltransferase J n=1 Tax=Brevundimonas goettingensis TaxID=2774190 RepID=A0A975C151_9CAUL|nr:23S rRNA (adenine(2030)-N(6))-methyltransferase RlmJ [Brevundimonas goettingensis]QTC91968.1 23S rRNA (adenine(2030)-N(6))-methyltransferase RlmJ [Brevundimonas goettingensis]